MIPKERTYPVFEANQVLTNRHLNDLFEFLDEQNRLTRTHLNGIGIVCGLDVNIATDSSSITITKGCGVTSEGYLAVLPDDPTTVVTDSITLTRWKIYHAPAEIVYPPFNINPGNGQINLWELFPPGEPDTLPIDQTVLQGKVLLLFIELNLNNLKSCSPNSCDDKGQEVKVRIRKLLLSESDMDRIIANADDSFSGPNHFGQFSLPDIALRRFDVVNSGVDTAMEIFSAYQKILTEAQPDGSSSLFIAVESALRKSWQAYFPFIQSIASTDPFIGKLTAIENRYRIDFFNRRIILSQYYYDFIADVIAAYHEFKNKAIRWRTLCCPDAQLFPRHLMLGEVSGNLAARKKYRHYFLPSSAQFQQAELGKEVMMLFRRLILLLDNFDLPALPIRARSVRTMRITPSKLGKAELSGKAIPYYYKVNNGAPPLYENWDYRKTHKGKASHNFSYHADQYQAPGFVLRSLEYDHEEQNFYRIEGHIGLPWRDAISDLLERRKRYRLSFDVIALNADQFAVKKDPQPGHCIDNDLNIIYKAWLKEAQCLFEKKVGFFSSFDLSKKAFTRLAGSRTITREAILDPPEPRSTSKRKTTALPASIAAVRPGITAAGSFTATTFFNVGDAIIVTEGSIGHVLKPDLTNNESGVNASVLLDNATESLKKNETVKRMSVEDFNVVVASPVRLIGTFAELSELIPDESQELDIEAVSAKYVKLKTLADSYLVDLVKLPDTFEFLPPPEKNKAIEELKGLLDNCLDKRLAELAAEILRRKKAAAEAIWFSNYIKKHPDIQHKGGVPTNGTFVIVYRETPNTPNPDNDSGPLNPGIFNAEIAANIADLVLSASGSTSPTRTETENLSASELRAASKTNLFTLRKKLTGPQVSILSHAFTDAGLTLDFGSLVADGIFEIDPEVILPNPPTPNVPEGIIIADFYLPYRCCSDCPPVQFTLPPLKTSFGAIPGCTNSDGKAMVTLDIISGEPPFEIKIGEGTSTTFKPYDPAIPFELSVGKTTVILKDSKNTESNPVIVEILPAMLISLGEPICNEAADAFNLPIFIIGGRTPFIVNGQAPIESSTDATGTKLMAGPFASGILHSITIKDASDCPPQKIEKDHRCLPVVPIAREDTSHTSFNTPVRIDVLGNDEGSGLAVNIHTAPSEGIATLNVDGSITFTPDPNTSNKTISFKYQITNNLGQSEVSTVSVRVGPRSCTLPCGGATLRNLYPLWISKPEGELIYEGTKSARLIVFNELGQTIFDKELNDLFNAEFPVRSSINKSNYEAKFKKLAKRINEVIAQAMGQDFFILETNANNADGTLSIEHFACHSFTLEIVFHALQIPGEIKISSQWKYEQDRVNIQYKQPFQTASEIRAVTTHEIDKCAVPKIEKGMGRLKTSIQQDRQKFTAITEPEINPRTSRFDWFFEWNKNPMLSGDKVIPEFPEVAEGKARLIAVDKEKNWGFVEKSFTISNRTPILRTPRKSVAKKATVKKSVKIVAKTPTKKSSAKKSIVKKPSIKQVVAKKSKSVKKSGRKNS